MKYQYIGIFLISGLFLVDLYANTNNTNGKTFFAQRSQGDNLARRIVGEEFLLVDCEGADWISGVGSIALEYTRSFDRNDTGTYFSFNKTPKMLFAGDDTPSEILAARTVRAEYFGLASNFIGEVEFRPKMENAIVDINLQFNLNNIACGLYFVIGIPVVWTRFGMNLDQRIENAGTTIDLGLGVNNPPAFSHSIIEAYKGKNGGIPIAGVVIDDLEFARIDGNQTDTSVANLKFILGYNIWCNDCGHFGINFRIGTPTGTRPKGKFVFEPVVGNGKHVEIGAGLSGHYILWENYDCYEESFSFWVEAEIHHLAQTKQKRTFALTKNGIGSQYIYLSKFNPDNTFEGTVIPAANITTLDADIEVSAAGEIVLMFDYQRCGFLFDVGYSIWGRSKEKIKLKGTIPDFIGVTGKLDAVTLGRTKSNATINTDGTVDGISSEDNVYLTLSDIDVNSAASPSAISHKIFGHLSYLWDLCPYAPFFGIGGQAEFSGRKNHALPQWGVWIKGGIAFN